MEQVQVSVGQVWQDWDSRRRNDPNPRLLRVVKTNARQTVVSVISGPAMGKERTIATRRFKPSTTGYMLVQNEDGSMATSPEPTTAPVEATA